MKYDLHLEWFRQRLSKLFAIPDLAYVDVLLNDNYDALKRFFDEDFASSYSSSQQRRLESETILDGDEAEQQERLEVHILYVYRTFYDRLVEKEIMVLEEVPHVQPAEPEPTKEKRKKGKGGGGGGGGNKEKRANRGDLKDEEAEVKLDRDFLMDAESAPATAAGRTRTGRKDVIQTFFSSFVSRRIEL